jgi:rubrerythrin
MNAFEYAMNMELDGKKFYEEQAAKMTDPALKRIFEELAIDEQHHYEIFKSMLAGQSADFRSAFKTSILATTKNVFQTMKDAGEDAKEFNNDVREAWMHAREIEDKAEKFYRKQAQETEEQDQKDMWDLIADEEHKHWVAMDNVIRFLDKPKQWLEDAEWSDLDAH